MGIMDKFKRAANEDNYDEMYGSDMYDDYGYNVFTDNEDEGVDDQGYGSSYGTETQSGAASGMSMGSAYNNANPTGGISISGAAIEMKVVKPAHFESVTQIADHLLDNRAVVLNLENTNKETARRLIDFLSGVAYSIKGSMTKVASNAYVITPNNVDVGDAQLKTRQQAQAQAQAETEAETGAGNQFGDM